MLQESKAKILKSQLGSTPKPLLEKEQIEKDKMVCCTVLEEGSES